MQRFGAKLRTLREKHGMSQRKLATELGIATRSFIHKLEIGEKQPNVKHLLKLSLLFGVSADSLIRDDLEVE